MKNALLAALVAAFITGCGQTQTAVQWKTYYPGIPTALTQDCPVTEPSDTPEQYAAKSWGLKEDAQTKLNRALYADLSACNKQIRGIREYDTKTRQTYSVLPANSALGALGASH